MGHNSSREIQEAEARAWHQDAACKRAQAEARQREKDAAEAQEQQQEAQARLQAADCRRAAAEAARVQTEEAARQADRRQAAATVQQQAQEAARHAAEDALERVQQEIQQARQDAGVARQRGALLLATRAHLTMAQAALAAARGPVRLLHVERLRGVGGRRQVAFCGLPGTGKSTMVARLLAHHGYQGLAAQVPISDMGIGNLSTFVGDMPAHNTVLFDQRGSTEPHVQDGEAIGADMLVIALGNNARASAVHGDLTIMAWRLRAVATAVIVVPKADEILAKPSFVKRLAEGGPEQALEFLRSTARAEVAREVGLVLTKAEDDEVAVDPSVMQDIIVAWLQTVPVFVTAAELQALVECADLAPYTPQLQSEWGRLASAVAV